MNINLSTWSAIAEIISSVAILVTLIYLAIQTRQNTAAIRASTRQTMISTDIEALKAGMDYSSALIQMRSGKEISDEEKNQIVSWLIMLVRTREYQWFQYKNGLLDKQTWEAYLTGLSVNLCFPRSRWWWDHIANDYFDHEFVLMGSVTKENSFYLSPNRLLLHLLRVAPGSLDTCAAGPIWD